MNKRRHTTAPRLHTGFTNHTQLANACAQLNAEVQKLIDDHIAAGGTVRRVMDEVVFE